MMSIVSLRSWNPQSGFRSPSLPVDAVNAVSRALEINPQSTRGSAGERRGRAAKTVSPVSLFLGIRRRRYGDIASRSFPLSLCAFFAFRSFTR